MSNAFGKGGNSFQRKNFQLLNQKSTADQSTKLTMETPPVDGMRMAGQGAMARGPARFRALPPKQIYRETDQPKQVGPIPLFFFFISNCEKNMRT